MFRDVPARPDYVELEHEVLRLWAETRAFEQLRAQTRGGPKWSFLDGPITANNPMGVHHAWGRTYKDLYNRYHAMLGQELRWQQGFDCQGLWVEVAVEKELGFTNKRQIEEYGVAEFVNKCKERVYHYAGVISEQSKRLGYWMDWDNSYFTLSDENNYSIWGFLKLCHARGWLYRGHDVMPWCPRCGTALSEHEIATEGYAEKTHLALTAAFPLLDRPGEALLAWTTTPWTLPANVAAAVHPELTYVRVEPTTDDRRPTTDIQSFWLAKGALETQNSKLITQNWQVVEERPGADLVGWRYRGPFDELAAQAGVAHRVVAWGEVSEAEGTGVVHIAPGAGKEDFALGQEQGLAVLAPLDDDGVYVDGYGWLSGRKASEVAEDVAADLERKGQLFHRELYTHRYPVCWRCGTELVFRLADEWLISMDELRHQMMDAAREATWIPSFGLERELDWLRNMDDWMISKKRYWGLALPIYPCDACGHVTVVGSQEELHERAVEGWEQFEGHSPHRPWVDAVVVACEHCGAPVARVPDVGNVWLDAGIVAFATLGYRHDRAAWQQWYPADLVLESFPGQFRNWFYALLAMSTALEGSAPFKTLLGHALVKDEHGEEMHKSKGNAIWFEDAAAWLGVEPLRWLFASVPLERNVNFGHGLAAETARRLQPLWEVYRFFVTYANLDRPILDYAAIQNLKRPEGTRIQSPLDQWLLTRLNQLIAVARERLDAYDARGFTLAVEAFLDDLSNWYVRRSRRRFWGTARGVDDADKQAAYATLYTTLVTLARLLAPVLPFLSEVLYQNLVRGVDPSAPASVHLTGYPEPVGSPQSAVRSRDRAGELPTGDWRLLTEMEVVRRVAGLGRVARKAAGLRVRQPLARMLVAGASAEERAALLRHQEHLLDELNVKALELLDSDAPTEGAGEIALLRYHVRPNLRLLGPRFGKALPALRAALEALDGPAAAAVARAVEVGQPVTLPLGDGAVALAPAELLVESAPLEGYGVAQEGGLQVALDTRLDDALRREGLARDLVRAVQEARKAAGLALSDRITLYLAGNGDLGGALDEWGDYVRSETLAEDLLLGASPPGVYSETAALDGATVTLGVARR
ncbi:MAG: isoleucine--tRNA ligase [Roseiflexaceae bacterium]